MHSDRLLKDLCIVTQGMGLKYIPYTLGGSIIQ